MRYRFEPGDFGWETGTQDNDPMNCETAARLANAKLAEWERASQKIYGAPNPQTGEVQIWTPKGGSVKLLRQDYTHMACIWNPRKFEEVK